MRWPCPCAALRSIPIRFWDIKKIGSGTAARYRVRWAVNGREHCRSFKARPLADGFLTGLKDAVRDRRPFDPRTGLPEAEVTEDEAVTWYAHARAYAGAKWANLAPVSRRSVAEALVTVTIALSRKEPGGPDPAVLRQALFAWAFNPPPATPARRRTSPPLSEQSQLEARMTLRDYRARPGAYVVTVQRSRAVPIARCCS
jgi:hypothetical protein